MSCHSLIIKKCWQILLKKLLKFCITSPQSFTHYLFSPQFGHLPSAGTSREGVKYSTRFLQYTWWPPTTAFQPAAQDEESAITPPPHTSVHRHWWLVSVTVFDREERMPSFLPRDHSLHFFLGFQLQMASFHAHINVWLLSYKSMSCCVLFHASCLFVLTWCTVSWINRLIYLLKFSVWVNCRIYLFKHLPASCVNFGSKVRERRLQLRSSAKACNTLYNNINSTLTIHFPC